MAVARAAAELAEFHSLPDADSLHHLSQTHKNPRGTASAADLKK